MKTNLKLTIQKSTRGTNRWLTCAALVSLMGLGTSCQDTYDLDEKLPPNFGSNLMTYLEENNFRTYARLAEDLNYRDQLSGVALKTIFVADDAAFDRFFQHNRWGVHSYEELTPAQKKLLFYGSMLDNSLQVMNLSSTTGSEGAVPGNAMRRHTNANRFDSVAVITPEEMPDNNPCWDYYRKNNKSIVCFKDASYAPITFFTENYLASKKITNDDMNFMFNYKVDRKPGDAWVGDTYIEEANIRSANGFIHRTHDVVVPRDNMAELIRLNPNSKIFNRLLRRFCGPYYLPSYGKEWTDGYNNEFNAEVDSVFALGFFSKRSYAGYTTMPNKMPPSALLTFDPGYNSYQADDPNAYSIDVAMQQDMGVMLVPTDDAMEKYWNEGIGASFKDYYGDWDNVPDLVVSKLINNCMLNSWVNTVPSKFADVVNSNQDPMHLTVDKIDSVSIACNGAIYWTNEVFSPTEYLSVSFPALINPAMNIFYWAIEQLEYRSYLNSLDSYYSFFIPTNGALLSYVNPVAYNGVENELWKFYYDPNATTEAARVWAGVWSYNIETGVVGDSLREVRDVGQLRDRLEDMLDNHIIVGNRKLGGVENGHEFYRTKNGGIIRIEKDGNDYYVQGTYQRDQNKRLKITRIYDESQSGNGKTYIIGTDEATGDKQEPIMTTRKSTFDVLAEHEEFSVFYDMLLKSNLRTTSPDGMKTASAAGNVASFRNFNYTVYVPTNESLNQAIAEGKLHTWEEVETLEALGKSGDATSAKKAQAYADSINAFLRYHIQDNLLMIGLDYSVDGAIQYDEDGNPISTANPDQFERIYETALINPASKKFYTLDVKSQPGELTVTDRCGNVRKVLKQKDVNNQDLYNLTVREYKLDANISASSFAAIHLIDGPLFYETSKN